MAGFVYLDESGDTGFKFGKGSSDWFVVTILLVEDPLPLSAAIDDLRKQLHYRERHEFKFVNASPRVRTAFLRVLLRHELMIRSLIVDKRLLAQPHMQEAETFYTYLVRLLLQHDEGRLDNATLILDQRDKGRKSKQALTTYLRRELNAGSSTGKKLNRIKYHESHRDNLLQAVDMACGAVSCNYARGDAQYLRILRVKLDDLWEFKPGGQ